MTTKLNTKYVFLRFGLLSFLMILMNLKAFSQSSIPQSNWWVPDGPVNAITKKPGSNITFIGGSFNGIYPKIAYGSPLNINTGIADVGFAQPNGVVLCSVPDGTGGWYIGGNFTQVGGEVRNRLAHLNAVGQVTSWDPNVNDAINTICLNGGVVYIGGSFTTVGGQTRNRIAAIDIATGTPTSWDPNANNFINAIIVDGTTLYVGGAFTNIGGQSRNRLASLDLNTGVASSWNPNASNTVFSIFKSSGTVYVGGNFTSIGGQLRSRLAAVDATTGSATPWNPNPNFSGGRVNSIIAVGNTIYVGGVFGNIGGQLRNRLAAIDASTGLPTSWDPDMNDEVKSIVISGNTLYAGGVFTQANGQPRNNIAAIDLTTGTATSWNPTSNGQINTLSLDGSTIYVGGDFTGINGLLRNSLVAIDATTGIPTSWAVANWDGGSVNALVLNGNMLYAGGDFTTIGGQPHNGIVALDVSTGIPSPWNPDVPGVKALVLKGSKLYVGGSFSYAGGQTRNNLAAVDINTGALTSWNPNASNAVRAMALSGTNIYVGGSFFSIGGQARNRVAAINISSGQPTSWNPNASYEVYSLLPAGNIVYIGGGFSSIGGQSRPGIAAIDTSTALATSWNPNVDGSVNVMALNNDKMYLGGNFTTVNSQTHNKVAVVDLLTGVPTNWDPNISGGEIRALAVNNDAVYIGGQFNSVGGESRSNLAAFMNCNVAPKKPGAITQTGGIAKICPGESRTYAILDVAGALGYTWTVPLGATIVSGQGTTSILVSFDGSLAASDSIKVVAQSECGNSAYRFFLIRRGSAPSAPGIITQSGGDPKICPAQTRTFTIAPVADISNYSWTVPTGATITSGQGTTSIVVSFNGSLAAVDTVKVASVNGCGTSVNRILKIYRGSGPHAPGVITQSGATKVCPGETRTYTIAAVPGAASYSWVVPTGAAITSGQGTTSINVSFNGSFAAADTIKVRTGDACGNSAYRLKIVTRDAAPKAPSAITGEAKGLCDQDGVAYSVTNTAGNIYAWSFNNANGSVATGQGTSAITANFTPGASSTTLSVTAANGCGTSAPRAAVFSAKPAKPASITGAAAVCAHAMGVQYSTPVVYGATSYTWGAPSGSTISDGVVTSTGVILTTTSHTVTVNFGASAGDVKVRADNSCASSGFFFKPVTMGCKMAEVAEGSQTDDIIVYPNPATDQVNITFQSHNPGSSYSIHLYDVLGKEVIITNGTTLIGTNQTQLNTSILASGVYHLVLKGEGLDYNTKVVLDK